MRDYARRMGPLYAGDKVKPPHALSIPRVPAWTARRDVRLLAIVPDIGRKLPVSSDLLPDDHVLASDFLRRWSLGLQAEGANLACHRGSEWLHVQGCEAVASSA
jgi:hypothetical protein